MSRVKPRRVPRSALVVTLVGGILALQLGQASPKETPRARDAVVVSADGDLDVRTSLDGLPVLHAADLSPGDSVAGVVTVHNVGTGTGLLSLDKRALTDIPGPGGGPLSEILQLVVRDVTRPLSPFAVYSGTLGSMPAQALGTLGPDQTRIYRFDATFPDGGPADSAYAGSRTSVAYKWTVGSLSVPPTGGSTPTTPGGTVPGPGFVQPGLKVKLALRTQRIRRRALLVRVRCTQQCSIGARAQIRVRGAKKGARGAKALGRTKLARMRGRPGRWAKVKLKLSKKTMARMARARKRRRKMTFKVTVNARTAQGRKAKAVKTARIR